MNLTDRQWELVELVGGRGMTYARAAHWMGISVRTAEEYAADIRDRSGLDLPPQRAVVDLYYRYRLHELPSPAA